MIIKNEIVKLYVKQRTIACNLISIRVIHITNSKISISIHCSKTQRMIPYGVVKNITLISLRRVNSTILG